MNITTAVIPVAGKGTRFLPATKQTPKEMLPILNIPMIQYVVEEAVQSGIKQVIFVTSEGKESIENYFDRNITLEEFLGKKGKEAELNLVQKLGTMIDVVSVRQKEQLGLGHAVMCAKNLVGNNNFVVILGDDLVINQEPVTKQLIDVSAKHDNASVIGVMEVPRADTDKYGIVDGEEIAKNVYKMKSMVEKPRPEDAPTCLATPGRYLLTPQIFDCLDEIPKGVGGEYQLTDAINLLASKQPVLAHIFEGKRYDTGNIEGHFNATIEFALNNKDLAPFAKELIIKKAKELM